MTTKKELCDLIMRMEMCLDDDFDNFKESDISNWIQELITIKANLNKK